MSAFEGGTDAIHLLWFRQLLARSGHWHTLFHERKHWP